MPERLIAGPLSAGLLIAGLLIATGPGEWRAALVEGEEAVELFVERGEGEAAGSLHLGRVRRLVPALGAVHVDIGGERPAFLPQSEIVPRGLRLDEGARLLVQVRREAQGGKAARVTTALRLRGRHMELVVGRPGLVAADRLPPEERDRLLAALAPHPSPLPASGERQGPAKREGEGHGFGFAIIEPGPIEALLAEMARLKKRWHDLRERAARLEPPRRLDPPQSLAAALAARLPLPPSHIAVDDPAALPEIRAAFPAAEAVHSPQDLWPIDLDAEFARALAPNLALAAGRLHIEATQAAVLIDVDSGTPETGSRSNSAGRTALAVNLAAAREIARQLRLRNLGGGIVVDFIGLEGTGARARVRNALAAALAGDPAGPQILGWTRLGHLELVRPRRGRPLAESLLEPCSGIVVKTPLTVAHEALRALAREERARPGRRWRLLVAPEIAAALAGPAADALAILERRLGRPIAVMPEPGRARERFEIVPA